jgi:uncharacterized membrane protein YfcA
VKRPSRQRGLDLSTGVASDASMPRLLAIGLAAGLFSALFGVGGGIIIVPLLVVVGLPGRAATGTSLAAISLTAAAGATAYALHGDVKPGAAAILGLPAVLGVVVGVALQQRLGGRTLTLGFALLLTAVGVRLLV